MASVSVGPSLRSRDSGTDAFRHRNVTFSDDLPDPGVHHTYKYISKSHVQPHAAPHTSQGSAHRAARCTLRPARLVFAPRQATSRRRARLRLYDRGLGCCRAEAGARLALGSGGGAASLRLMSFRLPCNGRKRDEGRCGARKEWWRPAPLTMAMLARTRPCLLWLDLLW